MSIPASHLRIGNYIFNGIFPEKVTSDTIWSMDKTGSEAYGVELTPEILEKAGFKEDKEGSYLGSLEESYPLYYNGINIAIIHGEYRLWINIEEDMHYSFEWTVIKYLHQLQNLFFSLTGQELQINL